MDWELRRAGPDDAEHTVLLLSGGLCAASSWAEVMARPELAGARLVAATLPGHAGTPPLPDPSVERVGAAAGELAAAERADVVAGFSMGATAAFEMVVAGHFAGPAVLAGISLSAADGPAFFRGLVRLERLLGPAPAAILARGAATTARRLPVPPARRAELRADFARNVAGDVRPALRAYLRALSRPDPAGRLCRARIPTWVVHAEHGDGGLTQEERIALAACEHIRLVTIPGKAFFLPVEAPDRIAAVVADALSARSGRDGSPTPWPV